MPWENARRRLIESFADSIIELSAELSGKPVVVDKITPHVDTSDCVAEPLDEFFLDAPIIQLQRDGRDVLTSGVFHWLTKRTDGDPDEVAERHRAVFVERDPALRLTRMFSDRDIEHWSRTWSQPIEVVGRLARGRDVLKISYEEMARDLHGVLSRIFGFVGVRSSPDALRICTERASFEAMSGGRKLGDENPTVQVRKGVVGDWRRYFTRRDGLLFHARAGDHLAAAGHELDDSWVAGLSDELSGLAPPPPLGPDRAG